MKYTMSIFSGMLIGALTQGINLIGFLFILIMVGLSLSIEYGRKGK